MFSDDTFIADQVVLIVAHSPAFAQSLMDRWQRNPIAPTFAVMSSNDQSAHNGVPHKACHMVIVEGAALHSYRTMLQRLDTVGTPILCALPLPSAKSERRNGHAADPVVLSPNADNLRKEFPRMITLDLADRDSGLDIVITVALEILKRLDAVLRARKADVESNSQSSQLALGKYVADSMHGFNNALTAVLGNAELLMLDVAGFSPQIQEEIEAIHSNAIRLHEMMQRFSSLEAEIEAGRKPGKSAAAAVTQAYLSGT
jgi:signal transduction histidine kinase